MKRTGLACIACLLVATLALFILLGTSRATAQGVSLDEGTEFVVVFQKNFRDWVSDADRLVPADTLELSLVISAETKANVSVSNPITGKTIEHVVEAGWSVTVAVDSSLQLTEFGEVVTDKLVRISSDAPITVSALSHRYQTTDAYLVLPVASLGTRYRAIGYSWLADDLLSQAAVAAVDEPAIVSITPVVDLSGGQEAGTTFTIELEPGDVYQFNPASIAWNRNPSDVSGTLIESDVPVALFSGHNCAYVPSSQYKACNILAEQVRPESDYGTRFFAARFVPQSRAMVRVLISEDETNIFVNNTPVVEYGIYSASGPGSFIGLFSAGDWVEFPVVEPVEIVSDRPVAVYSYSIGFSYTPSRSSPPDSLGDPMMVTNQPVERFARAYRLTPQRGTWHNYATIVAPIDPVLGVATVTVGGDAVTSDQFSPVGSGEWAIAQVRILGSQRVESRVPIGVTYHGIGYEDLEFDAYGLPAAAIGGSSTIIMSDTAPILSENSDTVSRRRIGTARMPVDSRGDAVESESRQQTRENPRTWEPIERIE